MAKRKHGLTHLAIVEYANGTTYHKFVASIPAADDWAASIMETNGNHRLRVTICEVLFSIEG